MQSRKFTLNGADVDKFVVNALVFAGPALLVLIASAQKAIPVDASYGVLALYFLNLLTDLLKKFLAGK